MPATGIGNAVQIGPVTGHRVAALLPVGISSEVLAAAGAAGISPSSLRHARIDLGVRVAALGIVTRVYSTKLTPALLPLTTKAARLTGGRAGGVCLQPWFCTPKRTR